MISPQPSDLDGIEPQHRHGKGTPPCLSYQPSATLQYAHDYFVEHPPAKFVAQTESFKASVQVKRELTEDADEAAAPSPRKSVERVVQYKAMLVL